MALHRKREPMMGLQPDVAVIPECASPADIRAAGLYASARAHHWVGNLSKKGLGVFTFGAYTIEPVEQTASAPEFIVPLRVRGPLEFQLLAVWAQSDNGVPGYVANVRRAIEKYDDFIREAPTVIAGDFNSSAFFDRPGRAHHAELVEKLETDLGLFSAYHRHTGEAHGAESSPSLFMQRNVKRPFHVDFVFLPQAWRHRLRHVEVGGAATWLPWSDHCPISIEIDL
jgi:hypothetical protein